MVTLVRLAYMPFGTYGRLLVENCDTVFYTVERPWNLNMPEISCIPEGMYPFVRAMFGEYESFRLDDIPGRSEIFLHIANWPGELKGCIGIGLYPTADDRNHVWGVGQSTLAHAEFMKVMGDIKETSINIRAAFSHGA